MAPLYPIAFVVIAFAYLGAPRTTRQSRTMSLVSVHQRGGGAAPDRLRSAPCSACDSRASHCSLQYIALVVAFGFGYLAISRGTIIEPPAFMTRLISAISERLSRRLGHVVRPVMVAGTLSRYFGLRFFTAVVAVFVGIFALVALVDYVEMMRRSVGDAERVRPDGCQDLVLPGAAGDRAHHAVRVLIGAMSCYLNLSRRLELVVARAAGMSAWQFIAPALIVALLLGVFATTVYNPVAAILQERSKRLEVEMFGGGAQSALQSSGGGFWVRQRSSDGPGDHQCRDQQPTRGFAWAASSFSPSITAGRFQERIEAQDGGPGAGPGG